MRALVTGATGFLGSHLVEACLAKGHDVTALVRATSDLGHLDTLSGVARRYADLADADAVHRALVGIDVVYHSAARVRDYGSRSEFRDANVVGTANLLAAARAHGVKRFVFVSSPSVVSDGQHQRNIDESYPYPSTYLNLYSETKAEAERLVLAANAPDFVTCAIRPRGVWGPRDWHGFMPKILSRMMARKMRDFSGGERVEASLCHCDNAAHACLLAATAPNVGGKAYFVTDDETVDVWRFMNTLADTFDVPRLTQTLSPRIVGAAVEVCEALWKLPALAHHRSPPVSRYGVSLLTRSATYDTSAARRDLGYAPVVTQSEGLARLRAWVDSIGGVDGYVRFVRCAHTPLE